MPREGLREGLREREAPLLTLVKVACEEVLFTRGRLGEQTGCFEVERADQLANWVHALVLGGL